MRCRATCPNYPRAWRFWWPTAWRTAGASLWKWRKAFPRSAATCSKRWAEFIITTRRHVSRIFQPRNAAVSPTTQRVGNGATARLAAGAAGAKEDRTQFGLRQGDQLYAAALEGADGIFTPARCSIG